MAIETKRIDDPSIPLATDLTDVTIPVMQGGVSKRLMAEQLVLGGTAYGVVIDNSVSNPQRVRVGNIALHQSLPIQRKMRGCLLKDDGTVNYYLDKNNYVLKENGTAAVLDGTDGQAMIELPEHWKRIDINGTKETIWISETQIAGFTKVPKMYVSMFKASHDAAGNKLASVVNTSTNYRGGLGTTAWDGTYRTLLGRPKTGLTLAQNRTAARNRGAGWEQLFGDPYMSYFHLFVVEYATTNSQLPFNPNLDANGFKQGGLGEGVTTLASTALWSDFNGTNPFIPCGHNLSLGSHSGELPFTMPAEYNGGIPTTVMVNSYRGIEMPFGHIYEFCDGYKFQIQSDADGGKSYLFKTSNPAVFNSTNDTSGYANKGEVSRASGYVKELITGEMVAKVATGAGSTTYWCDYFYTAIPASGTDYRVLLLGGAASSGASAGFALSHSNNSLSNSSTTIGSRLCYIP